MQSKTRWEAARSGCSLHLAIACGRCDQWIFLYHQFVLHTEVPDNSIADPVLFLHLVPFMAAAGNPSDPVGIRH